jgi:hypothetical protein
MALGLQNQTMKKDHNGRSPLPAQLFSEVLRVHKILGPHHHDIHE